MNTKEQNVGINIKTNATIAHLNIRKQGNDDAAILAIDVKVQAEVNAKDLAPAYGTTPDGLIEALYQYDPEAGEYTRRLLGMGEAESWADYHGHDITLAGIYRTRCDIKKIKASFQDGLRATLTMTIILHEPSDALVNMLAQQVKDLVTVHIEAQPELDL